MFQCATPANYDISVMYLFIFSQVYNTKCSTNTCVKLLSDISVWSVPRTKQSDVQTVHLALCTLRTFQIKDFPDIVMHCTPYYLFEH